jgi:hypothetical protein
MLRPVRPYSNAPQDTCGWSAAGEQSPVTRDRSLVAGGQRARAKETSANRQSPHHNLNNIYLDSKSPGQDQGYPDWNQDNLNSCLSDPRTELRDPSRNQIDPSQDQTDLNRRWSSRSRDRNNRSNDRSSANRDRSSARPDRSSARPDRSSARPDRTNPESRAK